MKTSCKPSAKEFFFLLNKFPQHMTQREHFLFFSSLGYHDNCSRIEENTEGRVLFLWMNLTFLRARDEKKLLQLSESLNQINGAWSRSPLQSDVRLQCFTLDVSVATVET